MPLPALPIDPPLARRLCGRPLLVLLDVDGTLSPIAPRPEDAVVSPETRQTVLHLATLPETIIALISGRSALDARRIFGDDGTWVIGNHGIELAAPRAEPVARGDVQRFDGAFAAARALLSTLAAREGGVLIEDKRWTTSIHYRLANPLIVPGLVAEVGAMAHTLGLRMTQGKAVLELRPPISVDKGTAAVELAERVGALANCASILCAGDDRTDEDAFTALRAAQPRAVTIRVGLDVPTLRSVAEFSVADPDEMRNLLDAVAALRRSDGG